MSEGRRTNIETEVVPCEVCRREVPKDEAQSPEGQEYLIFLCGLDCYNQWRDDNGPDEG